MNVDVRAHLERLEKRVDMCEALLGMADMEGQKGGGKPVSVKKQIAELTGKCNRIFEGPIREFEERYKSIQSWLKAEHADLSDVVMNTAAKRAYVLEQADFLRQTAQQLKEVEEMEQFINPPIMKEMPTYAKQLEKIESRGHLLADATVRLNQEVEQLVDNYAMTMNAISTLLVQWDLIIKELEKNKGTK
ncbi:unnamed protein product [Vitrella brassicaformis CCMP3155]|uniref:Uncharacterized protein n=1 Tax=Vitrella brassicaformis (strain CCMP3155) TaxID=1169540 RepID=A0A0G4H7V2_VITBC|nr:unnamed protein product [Vitrella brassicaformis CCMP3155]|eukprot:CEM39988.1 unnamed protein product [Vitrella brassicaformis CCMP3155]